MEVTIINIEANEQKFYIGGGEQIEINGYFVTARIKSCNKNNSLDIEKITVKVDNGPSQDELIEIRKQIAALFGKKLTEG